MLSVAIKPIMLSVAVPFEPGQVFVLISSIIELLLSRINQVYH
jgi:hypothetical protein